MAVKLLNRYNTKLHPIYKMFSWDLLFYYAIIYLFLTLEKGLLASEILFIDAICQISKLIFQLPCAGLIDLLKSRRTLILANIICAASILLLILSNTIHTIIISQIIFAISYNLRQLSESSILYETIPEHRSKHKIFSKIDSIGQAYYYYLDSVSALFAGLLFIINNYIPLILCFSCCCISAIISFKFKEKPLINVEGSSRKHRNVRKYLKDTKNILKFIFHSKRLKGLLLFAGCFTGLLLFFVNLRSIVLAELNLRSEYFGIVLAIIQIVSAISSKRTNLIQHKLKNKTLAVFAFVNIFPLILIGLGLTCKLPFVINSILIGIWLLLYAITKGPFYTLIKRYLQSFSPSNVTTRLYGLQTILSSIFATAILLFSSKLLEHISVSAALIIIGSLLSIIFVFMLDYMKSHVGLKPEEYSKSEITYTEVK